MNEYKYRLKSLSFGVVYYAAYQTTPKLSDFKRYLYSFMYLWVGCGEAHLDKA